MISRIKPVTPLSNQILIACVHKISHWLHRLYKEDTLIKNYTGENDILWYYDAHHIPVLSIRLNDDVIKIWWTNIDVEDDTNDLIETSLTFSAEDNLKYYIELEQIVNAEVNYLKQCCQEDESKSI